MSTRVAETAVFSLSIPQDAKHKLDKQSLDVILTVLSHLDDKSKSALAQTCKFFAKEVVDLTKVSMNGLIGYLMEKLHAYPSLIEALKNIADHPFYKTLGMKDLIVQLPAFRKKLIHLLKQVELKDLEALKASFKKQYKSEKMGPLLDLAIAYKKMDRALLGRNHTEIVNTCFEVFDIDAEEGIYLATHQMPNEKLKCQVLCFMAGKLFRQGKTEQAIKLVSNLRDKDKFDFIRNVIFLNCIKDGQSYVDLIKLCSEIKAADYRCYAVYDIFKSFADRKDYKTAETFIPLISPTEVASAYQALFDGLLQQQDFENVMLLLGRIKSCSNRDQILAGVSTSLFNMGEIESAIVLATRVKDDLMKYHFALIMLNSNRLDNRFIEKFEELVDSISVKSYRETLYQAIEDKRPEEE